MLKLVNSFMDPVTFECRFKLWYYFIMMRDWGLKCNALIWSLILLGLAHLGHPHDFYHVVRHHLLYRYSTCFKDFFSR